jgi:hypothetical protein
MSNYKPKTEEQLAQEGLIPSGTVCDCEVAEAIDKPSKAGNPMITLKLNVFDENGAMRVVFDYIVPSTNFGERKLRHASDAFGLMDKYEAGTVWADDFMHQMGKIEIGQSKPTPDYPMPKNIVTDYIGREEATEMQEQKKTVKKSSKTDIDDSIPF